ncbi:DUF6894 family protein [Mesorhizobium sp. P5_C1]
MATFYFDFRDDGELVPDREGLDFESFGEAKRQAIRPLTEITQ